MLASLDWLLRAGSLWRLFYPDSRDVGPHLANPVQLKPQSGCIVVGSIEPTIDRRDTMNATTYRLLMLHSKLDAEVDHEQKRSFPDLLRLLRLKKLRLVIRDHMARLASVRQIGMA